MKVVFQILSALLAILFSGCVSQQLSGEKHRQKLASRLETNESEIQFLSYGNFIVQIEDKNRKYGVIKGIIALTDSDLRLESRHIRYQFSKELTVIPLHEMVGISKIASQIHLKHGEEEIILEFNPPSSAKAKESETVFQLLASRGMPVYEVAELTRFPPYTMPLDSMRRRSDKPPEPLYLENYIPRDDYDPGYYGSPIRVYPNDSNGNYILK